MKSAPVPENEHTRLEALRSLNVLDSPADERFDRITRLASELFNIPMVLISFIDEDRQWIKSSVGMSSQEINREVSLCSHTIPGTSALVIEDASADIRFSDNPLVTNGPKVRFYAGHPLILSDGSAVGTLSMMDTRKRVMTAAEIEIFIDLARMIEEELAARQLATMDDLTRISNRRGFITLGQHALNICSRFDKSAVLYYFDIAYFRAINEAYGYLAGDNILQVFSKILIRNFRDTDVIARVGHDEFGVLLTNAALKHHDIIMERLQYIVSDYNDESDHEYRLDFNYVVMEYDETSHIDIDELLCEATRQMKLKKQSNLVDQELLDAVSAIDNAS